MMSFIDEARKLNASEYALIIGIVFSVIIPGTLAVYLHREDLFVELEMYKLILLAAAFTMPVILINFVALFISEEKEDMKGRMLVDSMAISCLVFYPALLISFFLALGYKWHIGVLILFQLLVFYLIKVMRKHEANEP